MKRAIPFLLVVALLAGCKAAPKRPAPPPLPMPPGMKMTAVAQAEAGDSTLLVKPKPSSKKTDVAAFHRSQGASANDVKRVGWSIVKMPRGRAEIYRMSGLFEWCETNRVYRTCVIPNDPLYPQLWGMQKIQADAAWNVSTSNNVVVAVIDTGVDYSHPDLAGNLWTGPDGEHGYTASGGSISRGGQDDHYHGTHVSGIVGAVGNNGLGVVGINWRTKILSLKFLNNGIGQTMDAILCIDKMIELKLAGHNIRIYNNSWGGGEYDPALEDAFKAAENAGILAVCAAGNDFNNSDIEPFYPAGIPVDGIVSVVASDESDNKAGFSNYGDTTTDLMAPGVNILSLDTNGAYQYHSGTSMAAPHVTGTVAAMFGLNPALTVAQAKSVLLNPDSLDQTEFFQTSTFGGRLNAGNALSNGLIFAPTNNRPPTLTVSGSPLILRPGGSATISATGSDPDGDTLHFTALVRVTSDTLGQVYQTTFLRTNRVNLTNAARAIPLGVQVRFSASDGRGGTASAIGDVFMEENPALVRTVTASLSLNPLPVYPSWELLAASESSATYALFFSSLGLVSGRNCCYPANTAVPLYRGLQPGPNIFRAQLWDADGNFANSQRLIADNGSTGIYAPEVRVAAGPIRGAAPLQVTADMSGSIANGVQYFSRRWNTSPPFAGVTSPVQTFSLTNLGLNAVEFVVHDPATLLEDKFVQLFTVLPRTKPLLSIARSGNGVLINWDRASGTDVLERSADLLDWQPYRTGLPPVSVPMANGACYFRVSK